MEVVLEVVELGTTNPFQNVDELVVLLKFLSFETKNWLGVAIVTLYWLPLFPKQELINMYVAAMFTRIILSFSF